MQADTDDELDINANPSPDLEDSIEFRSWRGTEGYRRAKGGRTNETKPWTLHQETLEEGRRNLEKVRWPILYLSVTKHIPNS